MTRGQKQFTNEFKKTIVELYNSGKTITELSSEYTLSKSTIVGCINKNKPISIDNKIAITVAGYEAILKKNMQLEEENEIQKKPWVYSQVSNYCI